MDRFLTPHLPSGDFNRGLRSFVGIHVRLGPTAGLPDAQKWASASRRDLVSGLDDEPTFFLGKLPDHGSPKLPPS
jgi:hypothetical protein